MCDSSGEWQSIVNLAGVGLAFYLGGACLITFYVFKYPDYFYFWSEKMEPRFFYWELLIIARKVMLMCASIAMVQNVAMGMILGIFVIMGSTCVHTHWWACMSRLK